MAFFNVSVCLVHIKEKFPLNTVENMFIHNVL